MEIRWIGHACFKLQGKNISVVTDPFGDEVGFAMPKTTCNILTISHDHFDHNNKTAVNSDITFDAAGEFEFRGTRIRGLRTFHDESGGSQRGSNTMFLFTIDGIKILHCGDLGHLPDSSTMDKLNDVDILLLPVGGNYTLPVPQAVELVHRLEPKIVVPMHFKVPGLKVDISPVDEFVKQLGMEAKRVDALKVNKAELIDDTVNLYILQPQAVKAAV